MGPVTERPGDDRFVALGAWSGMAAGGLLLARLLVSSLALPALEGWFVTTEDALVVVMAIRVPFVATGVLAFVASFAMVPFFVAFRGSFGPKRAGFALLGAVLSVLGAAILAVTTFAGLLSTLVFASLYETAATPDVVL